MMGKRWLAGVMLAGASAATATTGNELAQKFGARQGVEQVSLAPGGGFLAILVPTSGTGNALTVVDLAAGGTPAPILAASRPGEHLRNCRWLSDQRIICTLVIWSSATGQALQFTRLVAVNRDGSNQKLVSAQTNSRSLDIMQSGGEIIDYAAGSGGGAILMTRQYVPESTMSTHVADSRQGLGVDEVDTATLAHRVVEQPSRDAIEYISDGQGTVRIMGTRGQGAGGYDRLQRTYFYRQSGSRSWKTLSIVNDNGSISTGFDPVAVDADKNVVYGFDQQDGREALFKIALDGSMKRELVLARPDVDVDDLVEVGRRQRVVGVSYATDERTVEFFDPALIKLQQSFHKALAGERTISFVDANADESKLVMFVGSDSDPGKYYLFDRSSHKLEELVSLRPLLGDVKLASVRSVTYKAADGTTIPAYLTLPVGGSGKSLPAIVMPHGGPSARDEWGFDWLSQYYAARGFAVLQPEYRGSAGYGEAWFQKNGFQSWRTAIGDINDAGRYLLSNGIAAPGKLAIVGWSYGGYAALQSAVLDPNLYKAIVAIAPVTDLDTLRNESRNYTNFSAVDAFIGHGAHITQGSPAQNVTAIKAPVLLFHGNQDHNVGVGESRMMASRLKSAGKQVDYVEFSGLDHQLDDVGARTQLLDRSDAFLRKSLGL